MGHSRLQLARLKEHNEERTVCKQFSRLQVAGGNHGLAFRLSLGCKGTDLEADGSGLQVCACKIFGALNICFSGPQILVEI